MENIITEKILSLSFDEVEDDLNHRVKFAIEV